METFCFSNKKTLPFRVLIVSDNKEKIKESIDGLVRFFIKELLRHNEYNSDCLDIMTKSLLQNQKIEIKKGDIVLLIDLSNKLYSNHGKRRDFVFVDEELLPIDEKEKRDVIEDTYNAITEMWGLNDPIKNIPKTFII